MNKHDAMCPRANMHTSCSMTLNARSQSAGVMKSTGSKRFVLPLASMHLQNLRLYDLQHSARHKAISACPICAPAADYFQDKACEPRMQPWPG